MNFELNFFLKYFTVFVSTNTHKKKRDNKQMVKNRIDTHLLYTCKYFQIIYF